MKTQILTVSGMSCSACVGHVTRALQALDGVEAASVSLETGTATVTFDPDRVDPAQLVDAVDEEGYTAVAEAQS